MAFEEIPGGVTSAKGFLADGVTCGLKKSGKPDFALLTSETPALFAGAFTRNLFCAAPVVWCRKILKTKNAIGVRESFLRNLRIVLRAHRKQYAAAFKLKAIALNSSKCLSFGCLVSQA